MSCNTCAALVRDADDGEAVDELIPVGQLGALTQPPWLPPIQSSPAAPQKELLMNQCRRKEERGGSGRRRRKRVKKVISFLFILYVFLR